VCFNAQQCVEKYFKAVLTWKAIAFAKTHDLEKVLLLVPIGLRPLIEISELSRLSLYATVTRYPGDYEPITFVEARRAVATARRATPDAGSIQLEGRDGSALSPSERDVALVFQNFSLYPTKTVRENLEFPLRAPGRNRSAAATEIAERIAWAAQLLHIEPLL